MNSVKFFNHSVLGSFRAMPNAFTRWYNDNGIEVKSIGFVFPDFEIDVSSAHETPSDKQVSNLLSLINSSSELRENIELVYYKAYSKHIRKIYIDCYLEWTEDDWGGTAPVLEQMLPQLESHSEIWSLIDSARDIWCDEDGTYGITFLTKYDPEHLLEVMFKENEIVQLRHQ